MLISGGGSRRRRGPDLGGANPPGAPGLVSMAPPANSEAGLPDLAGLGGALGMGNSIFGLTAAFRSHHRLDDAT